MNFIANTISMVLPYIAIARTCTLYVFTWLTKKQNAQIPKVRLARYLKFVEMNDTEESNEANTSMWFVNKKISALLSVYGPFMDFINTFGGLICAESTLQVNTNPSCFSDVSNKVCKWKYNKNEGIHLASILKSSLFKLNNDLYWLKS